MNTSGKFYTLGVIGVYLILTLYYFMAEHSSWFIAIPVLFMGFATLAHSRQGGWAIPAALFLSSIGDYQGSEHNFILQIFFFALAHIAYIMDYIAKRKPSKLNKALAVTPFIYAIIFLSILIPNISNGVEIGAVIGYAIMIAIMGSSALMLDIKHKWWYVLAAALFIYSDSVIVYNKYIERIPNASMLIMITYYAAQGLFASLHLLRRKE